MFYVITLIDHFSYSSHNFPLLTIPFLFPYQWLPSYTQHFMGLSPQKLPSSILFIKVGSPLWLVNCSILHLVYLLFMEYSGFIHFIVEVALLFWVLALTIFDLLLPYFYFILYFDHQWVFILPWSPLYKSSFLPDFLIFSILFDPVIKDSPILHSFYLTFIIIWLFNLTFQLILYPADLLPPYFHSEVIFMVHLFIDSFTSLIFLLHLTSILVLRYSTLLPPSPLYLVQFHQSLPMTK